jgi:hypothetical protein
MFTSFIGTARCISTTAGLGYLEVSLGCPRKYTRGQTANVRTDRFSEGKNGPIPLLTNTRLRLHDDVPLNESSWTKRPLDDVLYDRCVSTLNLTQAVDNYNGQFVYTQ